MCCGEAISAMTFLLVRPYQPVGPRCGKAM